MKHRRLNVRPHNGRDTQRAHHNGGVRVGGTIAHHHTGQPVLRQFSQRRCREFIGDQNKPFWPGVWPLNGVIKMKQQALPQGAQIACALFQVTVGQCRKLIGKFFDDLLNRPLRDRAFIHFRKKLTAQARIGKQVRIEVKDGSRLFLRACGKALAVATKFIRGLFQRGGKPLALQRFIKR